MNASEMKISSQQPSPVASEWDILKTLLPLDGATVLELGCGNPEKTRTVAQKAASVLALEVDKTQLAKNRAITDMANVSFEYGGAEKIPVSDAIYDIVLMFKSLHHVSIDQMDTAFSEIQRVLKPGGMVYISEPVYEGAFNDIMRMFHDEKIVREAAFEAEKRAVSSGRLALVSQQFFLQPIRFDNFEQFEELIIKVTHTEHRLAPKEIIKIRSAFNQHMTSDGAEFEMPMRVDVFKVMTDISSSTSPNAAGIEGHSFKELPLSPSIQTTLQQLEYRIMTPIQAASLPITLAGHDLIAQAKTGSGKTAAFALTLLTKLNPRRFAVQALVLCPTRELADQVAQEIRRLARSEDNIKILALYGGKVMRPQMASLERGAHIVVGTPGRIMDHLQRGSLNLDALNTLVLDEADRMLDMGFYDDIAFVTKQCPVERQTLLFSATYPDGISRLASQFMRHPQEVKLLEQHEDSKIRQRFYEVDKEERLHAVGTLLKHYRPVSTLAFCNTRQQCRDLVDLLHAQGFHALTLNGDLEQSERDQVLVQFANRSCSVLVATDVAARGLDIAKLEAVINVDVTPDPEMYVHRIGRTGRADEEGWALSLCAPADKRRVAVIAKATGNEPEWHSLDSLLDDNESPLIPPMVTLQILGGRKEKIRPGDVLGALTGEAGFTREQVGKITVTDQSTYVAVVRNIAREAVRKLSAGKVKGKKVKVRALEN